MHYFIRALRPDGSQGLGSDFAAVRSDLRTDRGALKWARAWLRSRASLAPNIVRVAPTSAILECYGERYYGEPLRTYTVTL